MIQSRDESNSTHNDEMLAREFFENSGSFTKEGFMGGKPKENQDCLFVDKEFCIAGVFDGVGGAPGGKEASTNLERFMHRNLQDMVRYLRMGRDDSPPQICEKMEQLFLDAAKLNSDVVNTVKGLEKASTTAAVVMVWGKNAYYVALGNSRISAWVENKGIGMLTLDHNMVRSVYADKGEEAQKAAQRRIMSVEDPSGLSPEDLSIFNSTAITGLVGKGGARGESPEVGYFEIEPGSKLLLQTDGLDKLTLHKVNLRIRKDVHDKKDNAAIAEDLVEDTVRACADKGNKRAYNKIGYRDDTTAVLIG